MIFSPAVASRVGAGDFSFGTGFGGGGGAGLASAARCSINFLRSLNGDAKTGFSGSGDGGAGGWRRAGRFHFFGI